MSPFLLQPAVINCFPPHNSSFIPGIKRAFSLNVTPSLSSLTPLAVKVFRDRKKYFLRHLESRSRAGSLHFALLLVFLSRFSKPAAFFSSLKGRMLLHLRRGCVCRGFSQPALHSFFLQGLVRWEKRFRNKCWARAWNNAFLLVYVSYSYLKGLKTFTFPSNLLQ